MTVQVFTPYQGRIVGLFAKVGDVIGVLDSDRSSAVTNVEAILQRLIAKRQADAFYTCGSNRLLQLMKRVAREHRIPGQAAMEQIMACGLGPCYICVRTFEVNGKQYVAIASGGGPMKTIPASPQARAKAAFSARKP